MLETILLFVLFLFLTIASYRDIKTKEVPDWINFAATASALGIRLIYSTINWDYQPILSGALGFAFFYVLAYAMFYTGQWGGGDSKLLMAIGAFLGFELNLETKTFAFLVALVLSGAIYGTIWSFVLALRNRKQFFKNINTTLSQKKFSTIKKYVILAALFILFIGLLFKADNDVFLIMLFLSFSSIFFFYLFIFIKSVENCCMIKHVDPAMLTEGDWIAKDIIMKGKKICGPGDLGISKKQIHELIELKKKHKISKVLLKTGIPFVPSFLLAFLIMIRYGNILLGFIQ